MPVKMGANGGCQHKVLLVLPSWELLSVCDWLDGIHMVGLVSREGCIAQKSGRCTCYCQTGVRVVVSGAVGVYQWGLVPEVVPAGGRAALHAQAGVPGRVVVVSCCCRGRGAAGLWLVVPAHQGTAGIGS